MDRSSEEEEPLLSGAEVVAVDGESVGKLATVVDGYLIVEQGRLFPKDYEVPVNAIAAYDAAEGVVALTVTKDQLQLSGLGERGEEPLGPAPEVVPGLTTAG